MRIAAIASALATSACAGTGALSAGATIDGDGHPGVEVAGYTGYWLDPGSAPTTPAHAWIIGMELALGASTAGSHVQARWDTYLELLQFDAVAGWHARLALGVSSWLGGSIVAAMTAGPYRIANGATATDAVTGASGVLQRAWHSDGIDLSLRVRLLSSRTGSPWQLAALYTHETSWQQAQ